MSEEPEKPSAHASAPAHRRPRLRPYVHAWLFATFLVAALGVIFSLDPKQAEAGNAPMKALLVAPVVALLVLPSLWLTRLFPERSPSTWLRFVRRLLVGVVCGAFTASLLVALIAKRGDAKSGELAGLFWVAGAVFGFIAGLVDSLHVDAERAGRDALDDELR
jgi:MFS family permease